MKMKIRFAVFCCYVSEKRRNFKIALKRLFEILLFFNAVKSHGDFIRRAYSFNRCGCDFELFAKPFKLRKHFFSAFNPYNNGVVANKIFHNYTPLLNIYSLIKLYSYFFILSSINAKTRSIIKNIKYFLKKLFSNTEICGII